MEKICLTMAKNGKKQADLQCRFYIHIKVSICDRWGMRNATDYMNPTYEQCIRKQGAAPDLQMPGLTTA